MARELIEENLRRVEQIVQSSILYSRKEREMLRINEYFIEKYCDNKGGFVIFPLSKITRQYLSVKHKMTKIEFIQFACSNWIFHKSDSPTYWDLMDTCLYKKIVRESEAWNQYSIDDLRELIDRSNSKHTRFTAGKLLFLYDINYLYDSPPNNYNLRNLCIYRGLLSEEEFGEKVDRSEVYENLLDYTPIMKDMKMDMKIWATFTGYEKDKNYSYFDFLGVKSFPKKLGRYIDMQESGHITNYNLVANRCHREFINNIEDIVRTMDDFEYNSNSRQRIMITFLREKYPDALDEIRYSGRCNSHVLVRLKVDEILHS